MKEGRTMDSGTGTGRHQMRIGINASSLIVTGSTVDDYLAHARIAEEDGFASWWMGQLASPDALTILGVVGRETSTIELGTAVVPTWSRHPLMLAAQALTTQEMAGGRLALGIGPAHKSSVESTLRIPFVRPAAHMSEYLSVLLPTMAERKVVFEGEIWSGVTDGIGGAPAVEAPRVLLAAMGARMLELAGTRTDGTVLWLSGPRTIDEHVRPALAAASGRAGRPVPRIVASVPVCVTDEPDRVLELIATLLTGYNDLPSYRTMMDREGVEGPAGVSIVGDEATVRAGVRRFADAGTTDFTPVELVTNADEAQRTRALLKDLT
jgi:5,10-methylenetetrahydromethanopterin reductase